MSASYFLKLNHFEGPLDLLLYLIKLNEVDIFEVNLVDLSHQYLDYLRLIQFADLRDASAFLAMAASLCEIKTRRLLPDSEKQASEGEEEEDSEEALRRRLIEYKEFKEAGSYFMDLFNGNQTGYPPIAEWERLDELYKDYTFPLRGDPPVLLVLYEQLLSTLSERRPVTVKAKREIMTMEQIIDKLIEDLRKVDCLLLHELYDKMTSRYELVAYILAMLELLRSVKELRCYQEDIFSPLWLYWEGSTRERGSAEGGECEELILGRGGARGGRGNRRSPRRLSKGVETCKNHVLYRKKIHMLYRKKWKQSSLLPPKH